jgi:hypothetical protein
VHPDGIVLTGQAQKVTVKDFLGRQAPTILPPTDLALCQGFLASTFRLAKMAPSVQPILQVERASSK